MLVVLSSYQLPYMTFTWISDDSYQCALMHDEAYQCALKHVSPDMDHDRLYQIFAGAGHFNFWKLFIFQKIISGKNVQTVVMKRVVQPCIRLPRGKFELTNQDSAGGKKFTVLASMQVNRKGIEIRQLFSLEIALNIHERGFTILKTISHWKIWNILCLQASNLAPNGSSSTVAM